MRHRLVCLAEPRASPAERCQRFGHQPNRLVGFVARELATIEKVLDSSTWESLNEELQQFVTSFSYKIVPYREGFQL